MKKGPFYGLKIKKKKIQPCKTFFSKSNSSSSILDFSWPLFSNLTVEFSIYIKHQTRRHKRFLLASNFPSFCRNGLIMFGIGYTYIDIMLGGALRPKFSTGGDFLLPLDEKWRIIDILAPWQAVWPSQEAGFCFYWIKEVFPL